MLSTNGIDTIRRILVEAGIATCFSHVFSGDVQPRKAESMRRFLGDQRYAAQRCCTPAYREEPTSDDALESTDCVLVTDIAGCRGPRKSASPPSAWSGACTANAIA